MKKIKLLISARDPAAAGHLLEVIRLCLVEDRFDLVVVAQGPAASFLRKSDVALMAVDEPIAKDPHSLEAERILGVATDLIKKVRPDAVLCGLSAPGEGGIDEALLAVSEVPSFLLQDFWGEQNSFFPKGADCFFVLDAEAARLSTRRHNKPSVVVGSSQHAKYASLDLLEMRGRVRRKIFSETDQLVIGFFGQSLSDYPGYQLSVSRLAEEIRRSELNCGVMYKPHPRESDFEQARTVLTFETAGVGVVKIGDRTVEEALAACDVACSTFSNCLYDAAFMNFFSKEPFVLPVAILLDKEINEFLSSLVNFDELPYGAGALAYTVRSEGDLRSLLSSAEAIGKLRRRSWDGARNHLKDPGRAPRLILDEIERELKM